MNQQSEKLRVVRITIAVIYLLVVILSVYLVWQKKLVNLQPSYIINVGVDIFGMMVGFVLYTSSAIDVRRTGVNLRSFMFLHSVAFLGLFTDLIAWLVDGVPELRTANIIDNTIYYWCMPLAAYSFWLYVKSVLDVHNRLEKIFSTIMNVGLGVGLLLRFANMFGGFYFSVNEAGVYSRGPWYLVSLFYGFFTTIATMVMILRHRKKLNSYQLSALILYVVAPTLAAFFTIKVYGLSISFGVIMLVILLMYCVLNIAQGREKEIMDRELAMATAIQDQSVPHDFPPFPERAEFRLHAKMNTAREVGGDFYDYYLIDDDHLAIVIADVSGKGIPAALFMMSSKIRIENITKLGTLTPGQILARVNDEIAKKNSYDMFVTVWLGILEISTGKMIAANAGHEYPVIYRKGQGYSVLKDEHGLVIGAMEGMKYPEYEIEFSPGDALFQYTDGVPDATNISGEQFGLDRVVDVLNEQGEAAPEAVLDNMVSAVEAYMKGAAQFDDITMVGFKYIGPEAKA